MTGREVLLFLCEKKKGGREISYCSRSARKVWRRAPVLVRSSITKRSGAERSGVAPTKTAASRAAHRDAACAPRGGDARALSLQLRGVVRARPDYRETQRATSVRLIGGTSIKSRKPLIGVDVHARCRVESVRHVSSSREEEEATSCFSRRARGDPDPESAVCLECVYAFSFLSYFISRFFFSSSQGAARSKAHDLERGGMYGETRVNNDDSQQEDGSGPY